MEDRSIAYSYRGPKNQMIPGSLEMYLHCLMFIFAAGTPDCVASIQIRGEPDNDRIVDLLLTEGQWEELCAVVDKYRKKARKKK